MHTFALSTLAITALFVAGPTLAQVTLNATALDALEQAKPDEFRKVSAIYRIASDEGCASAARTLKARFDVTDARCEPNLLMTSDPPKQRLTFTLEGTPYVIFVRTRGMKKDLIRKPPQ
jgi:hypothetical protein